MGMRRTIVGLEEKLHSKTQYLAVVWPEGDWNTDPLGIKVQPFRSGRGRFFSQGSGGAWKNSATDREWN